MDDFNFVAYFLQWNVPWTFTVTTFRNLRKQDKKKKSTQFFSRNLSNLDFYLSFSSHIQSVTVALILL